MIVPCIYRGQNHAENNGSTRDKQLFLLSLNESKTKKQENMTKGNIKHQYGSEALIRNRKLTKIRLILHENTSSY